MIVFLILYVDDILIIGNDVGTLSMAVETVRYERLRRSQSHSWDQASVRLLEKNVGLIPSNLH